MKRNVRIVLLILSILFLVQCPTPWHTFDNPVDPDSPTYIGTPSEDHNGNGKPQYIDVDEIALTAPPADVTLGSITPVLETYRFKPELVQRYWLQVATDGAFATGIVLNADTLPTNQYQVPAGLLDNSTTYFWRAKAFDGTNWSSGWSEVRAFSIHLDLGVPASPAPSDGAPVANRTPDLSWSAVAGAEDYRVQVAASSTMADLLVDVDVVAGTSYHVGTSLSDGTYYWRVRIRSGGQWGDWSATWSFVVITAPEINLEQGGAAILSGTGSYGFGGVLVQEASAPATFTVENLGTAPLDLAGVTISGTDAGMFVVEAVPSTPVAIGGTTTFTIVFTPSSVGGKTAAVTVASDDSDEFSYTFTVSGTGTAPEIGLKQGSTTILSGGGGGSIYSFGMVLKGTSSLAVTFTVENTGTGNLGLTGSPRVAIGGPDAAMFAATQPGSPVAPSASTTFTIIFSPTSTGAKSATVTIANTDSDENPYTFSLTGTGVAVPEIDVTTLGGIPITSVTGSYDFATVVLGSGGSTASFTINNSGEANLLLIGAPNKVSISGPDAGAFTVTLQPNSPVGPSTSTSFSISFNPSSPGDKTATVTMPNNDSDEFSYTFTLTGFGLGPEMNLKQGSSSISTGGAYGFGSVLVGATSGVVTFTVENLGNADLHLAGSPKVSITGPDAAMFPATQPGSPVAPAGITTFAITFSPTSVGAKTASVTIANDDPDENPYTFTLSGAGVSPEINLKQGSTNISSGGAYGFGNVLVAGTSGAVTFMVENLGTADLHLTGTPKVSVTGPDAALFVATQPSSPVVPAGSTTFTLTFSPTSLGGKSATVTIATDDLDEYPYTFTLSGTGISPEMNLKQGSTSIPAGGAYGFGSVLVAGTSGAVTFTVENLGTADLHLTGTPKVSVTGTDAAMFVATQLGSPVVPAANTTFTITFSPASVGAKSATVTIANDDLDEHLYSFTLSGTGISPEINLKQGSVNIPAGGAYPFGNVLLTGTSGAVTFTVENLGTADLHLTGSPKVSVTGADAAMFVATQPSSPVVPAGTTTFTITFTPASLGGKSALVTVANDDPDESPYAFALSGTGVSPEINVKQGSMSIATGGAYGFGNVLVGGASGAVTFTVENPGTADLHLTGTPKVSVTGTDAAMFAATQPSTPVVPAGTATFTITFAPASLGAKIATMTIASDDLDENPYVFTLSGTGISPEINLKQGSTSIPTAGAYAFGSVLVAGTSGAVTFTVENLGTADLHLTGTPKVSVTGPGAALFVATQPSSPVVPAGSATFTITFNPTSLGSKTATVTIANDDLDENPYAFTVSGTGISPEINLQQGSADIPTGGAYGFGNVLVAGTSGAVTFTVENLGTADLHLTGTPKVSVTGTDAALFVATQPSSPVVPAGSTTFTITFNPTSIGSKTAAVTIGNDDVDESSYAFTLSGTGVSPEINLKQGSTSISAGGAYGFGNVLVMGTSGAVTFTVENLGTADLHLTGTPKVSVTGADAALFVATQPGSPVLPAGTAMFTITFSPTSLGAKSATVTVANDDLNENPYTFILSGTGVSPEVNLKQGSTSIATGGAYGFGNVLVAGTSGAVTLTVENLGTADLHLTGTPKVSVTGTDAAMFVATQPGSPVVPAGITTFTITFGPTSLGAKTATVTVASDDLDENPYTFTLSGTGVSPEIDLKQGSTNIATGGAYGFVDVLVAGTSGAVTFTVENLGTANLNLTGTPKVSVTGTDAAMFVATQPGSPVVPAANTTFMITFSPTSVGAKTATVTVANDDLDENPYTFTLSGTGMSPEINLKQGPTDIATGGAYGFGAVLVAGTSGAVTFTVENLGTANLNLTGTPKVSVTGTDAAMFVATQPGSPVVPAANTTFMITFSPTSVGAKTATVTVANDDLDENPYTFTLSGTGMSPEINLKQGSTDIATGGAYGFGAVLVAGTSGAVTFTVENLGTADLHLTGSPEVSVTGTDAAMFVATQPSSPVTPAGTATFTITFSPGSLGSKAATVTIASDDVDENPYAFTLSGTGVSPEVNLKQGSTSISTGGAYGFGSVRVAGTSGAVTFTVENLGTSGLHLTGTPKVSVTGTDAATFVATQPASPVAPAGTATFTITFNPTSIGARSATVSIANDDLDENPYTYTLSGTGVSPEINLKQGSTDIAAGGAYDFGSVLVAGTSGAVTFTVENLGTADLNLTGTPKVAVTGADAALFTATQPGSPVAPAGTATFTIAFSPMSLGSKTATVTIANDDLDESSYTFTLSGTGLSPEINLKQGSTTVSSGGVYGFGSVLVAGTSGAVTFTVENLGTADLHLTGTSKVSVTGTDAGMFVATQPGSPVAPAGTTAFTITFSPTGIGTKSATVTIANDDLDENPYTFALSGTGISPEINVKQGSTIIATGGEFPFGTVLVRGTSGAVTFTVENLGTADLHLTGTPKVSVTGADAAMFVATQPGSPVVPAGGTTFTIAFSPMSVGTKAAMVTIESDDPGESSYTFTLSGTGISPEINLKQGSTTLPSGAGTYDFGNVKAGTSSSPVQFTVENLGTADLYLTDAPRVVIGGADAGMFSVTSQPGSPIAPTGATTLTITFNPSSYGVKTATLSIANDDLDENPYTVSITGMGVVPDIDVRQGGASIPSGSGSHDFGKILTGTSGDPVTFTIENLAEQAELRLTGNPLLSVTGTDAAMFEVGTLPSSPVAPLGSTTFTITFRPTSIGLRGAQLSIASDDPDENPYVFTLSGEGGTAPEINLAQDSDDLPSGGSHSFGGIRVGTPGSVTFTVENLGNAALTLSGTPHVVIGGTDAGMFSVDSQPTSPIDAGTGSTFIVTFTPNSFGAKTATMTIASNDADESPYILTLTGTGVEPEINLRQGSTDIGSGGSYGFGDVALGAGGSVATFTVENLGTGNLGLTGTPALVIDGADGAMFVATQPPTPVAPSGRSTFTITFTPTSTGLKGATVTIHNDDADENPYTFALSGTGVTPEINVEQDSIGIPSGAGSYDFGSVDVGFPSLQVVFTLQNLGTADLHLTGTPKVSVEGADAAMFSVDTQPSTPVSPAGATTLAITFHPASTGPKTATVTISSNDLDESPYTFHLAGTGVTPEMNVKQGAASLLSGIGTFAFPNIAAGTSSAPVMVTIENLGAGSLNLTGATRVVISGTDASMFSVLSQPGSPVAPLSTTTFQLVFSPPSNGNKRATVSIANNDSDENPYTFEVTGRGV